MGAKLQRTTIFLTPEQHEGLRRLAFDQRTSMANLLRDAAIRLLEDDADTRAGLQALPEDTATVTWRQYLTGRRERRRDL